MKNVKKNDNCSVFKEIEDNIFNYFKNNYNNVKLTELQTKIIDISRELSEKYSTNDYKIEFVVTDIKWDEESKLFIQEYNAKAIEKK